MKNYLPFFTLSFLVFFSTTLSAYASLGFLEVEPVYEGVESMVELGDDGCSDVFPPTSGYTDYYQYCINNPDDGLYNFCTYYPDEFTLYECNDFGEYLSFTPSEEPSPDYEELIAAVNNTNSILDNLSKWVQGFVIGSLFIIVGIFFYYIVRF